MKKKLPLIGLILAVLLTAWSIAAILLLRGVGAYRIGTKLGGIFAASRPYTLLAAILLAVALIIWLITRKSRKAAAIPAASAQPDSADAAAPASPKKAKKKKTGGKKIPPASAVPLEMKIPPMPPVEDSSTVLTVHDTEDLRESAETVLIQPAPPRQEETVLLSVEETHIEPETTEILPAPSEDAPRIQTLPPEEEEENDGATELLPAGDSVTPCCPQCGTPIVKEGQRFCAKCGAELKGGGK